MKLLKHLPNALTLSNLFMGTTAILLYQKVEFQTILLLLGGCLAADISDGAIARKLGVSGGLGVQLDSLADMISFGVLPALIVYHFYMPFLMIQTAIENGMYLVFAGAMAVSAGLRLARFNVDTRAREYFWGLPTPAGAIMVAGVGWAVFLDQDTQLHPRIVNYINVLLPAFLAIMYQAPLKLPGLKSPKPGLITLMVIVLMTAFGFIFIGPLSITLGIFLYVLSGIVNLVVKWY